MNSFSNNCHSTGTGRGLRQVTAEELREAFTEHPEELVSLALFLTASEELAKVCMVDACALAAAPIDFFVPFERWVRYCTIRSAVEMEPVRIAQLADIYERRPCPHGHDAPLPPIVLDMVAERLSELRIRLDVLSRAALVLRGMEGYSTVECGSMLGVTENAVEAAYCAALESVEIVAFETVVELATGAEPCC